MPASLIPCRRWLLRGRVQGVGYRWFVRQAATDLGLAGTVRNLPDGGVEVVARGPQVALAALEERLRTGPPLAQVRQISQEPGSLPEDCSGFQIVR